MKNVAPIGSDEASIHERRRPSARARAIREVARGGIEDRVRHPREAEEQAHHGRRHEQHVRRVLHQVDEHEHERELQHAAGQAVDQQRPERDLRVRDFRHRGDPFRSSRAREATRRSAISAGVTPRSGTPAARCARGSPRAPPRAAARRCARPPARTRARGRGAGSPRPRRSGRAPTTGITAGERGLVRIARDPALAPEVGARRLRQQLAHEPALRRGVDGVHAVEPVADPAGARLEHDDAQLGELREDAVLEERRERVSHGVGRRHVDEERVARARDLAEAARRAPLGLEARMDAERQPELLRGREHAMVILVAERLAGHRERRHPHAAHAVAGRAAQLALRRRGIAERELRDRNQTPAGIRAEIDDPAVVGAQVGLRELLVLALGDPEHAERRIQERALEVLEVEAPQALRRIHRAERREIHVVEAGLVLALEDDAAHAVHRARGPPACRRAPASTDARRSRGTRGRSRPCARAGPGCAAALRGSAPTDRAARARGRRRRRRRDARVAAAPSRVLLPERLRCSPRASCPRTSTYGRPLPIGDWPGT